jgi:hypothetical protein
MINEEEVEDGPAEQTVLRLADHRREPAIHERDAVLDIDHADAFAGGVFRV